MLLTIANCRSELYAYRIRRTVAKNRRMNNPKKKGWFMRLGSKVGAPFKHVLPRLTTLKDKARGRNTATANDLEDQQQSETEKTESASPSEHEVLSDHDSDSTAARSDSSSERSDLFTLDVWDLLDVFAAYEIVVDENVDYRAWLERFLYNMESRLRANFYWSHQLVASWDLEASVGEGAFA